MKAKVKTTGQIIDVKIHGMKADGTPISFYNLDGWGRRNYFNAEDLELESEKYETQDEWNKIYKNIEELCKRIIPLTVKNNSVWSDVHRHLDAARELLSADKDNNKW